ncbi:hypothetical protein ABTY96_37675 [Streptomyces sp. NPDC096057]|uniref:hypothetical protein n=1 Tax=Streptomyces sp. NPDC096057 TaxID=3155543 RepID=UPI00332F1112
MGKRVLAAFGVVAPMDGVLASGLSAAPTSKDGAPSTAERTCSSEEARLRAPYRQAAAEGGRHVVFACGGRSGQDDYLKSAFEKKPRCPRPLQGPPQPLDRRCTPPQPVRPHPLSHHPIDQQGAQS